MKTIYFDIETGGLPEEELLAIMPPFDPDDVKLGNIKDPLKVQAKIDLAREKHKRDFIERAALCPLTGRVMAVGIVEKVSGVFECIGDDDEAELLRKFWKAVCFTESVEMSPFGDEFGGDEALNRIIGFNVRLFDLPFLVKRSWKHRVAVPARLRSGRYWSEQMVDLRDVWQLGDSGSVGSLGRVAKHLGVGQKNGDGAAFARLWREDRETAMAYLRNDLDMTVRVAQALGF